MLEALSREWTTKADLVEATETSHASVERALAVLSAQGKLETSGGRGHQLKFWRLVDERQGVLVEPDSSDSSDSSRSSNEK